MFTFLYKHVRLSYVSYNKLTTYRLTLPFPLTALFGRSHMQQPAWYIARIPRRRHRQRHPRKDRRENVGVSFSLPHE